MLELKLELVVGCAGFPAALELMLSLPPSKLLPHADVHIRSGPCCDEFSVGLS